MTLISACSLINPHKQSTLNLNQSDDFTANRVIANFRRREKNRVVRACSKNGSHRGGPRKVFYVSHIANSGRNRTEMAGRSKEALRKWKEKTWRHREAIRGC
jgi:hypothetical protein